MKELWQFVYLGAQRGGSRRTVLFGCVSVATGMLMNVLCINYIIRGEKTFCKSCTLFSKGTMLRLAVSEHTEVLQERRVGS